MNNLHHPDADDDFVESSIDLGRGSNQRRYLIREIGQTVAVELIKVHFLRTCGTAYLWYMKICLLLVDLTETAEQLSGVMWTLLMVLSK